MADLKLSDFSRIMGSNASIGYVSMDADGKLIKCAAHRGSLAGRNVSELAHADSKDNAYIRQQMYMLLKSSLTARGNEEGMAPETKSFLEKIARELGVTENKNGYPRVDVSTPLERRAIRQIMHSYDVFVNGRREKNLDALKSKDATWVKSVTGGAGTLGKVPAKELKGLYAAVLRLPRDTGISREFSVNGNSAWITRGDNNTILVELKSGTVRLREDQISVADIENALVKDPEAAGIDNGDLLKIIDNQKKPDVFNVVRDAKIRHGIDICTSILLRAMGGGENGLKAEELGAVSPYHLRTLAKAVLDGRIEDVNELRETFTMTANADLENREDILALVDKFKEAAKENAELVQIVGEEAVNAPVQAPGVNNVEAVNENGDAGEPEVVKNFAKAIKDMCADIIREEDSWEVDRRSSTPGMVLQYTLSKHAETLARLMCDTEGELTKLIPSELQDVLGDAVDGFRDQLNEIRNKMNNASNSGGVFGFLARVTSEYILKVPEIKAGNEKELAQTVRLFLASPQGLQKLAEMEKQINEHVDFVTSGMQFMVNYAFDKSLSGNDAGLDLPLDEICLKMQTAMNKVKSENPGLDADALYDEAAKLVKEEYGIVDANQEEDENGGDMKLLDGGIKEFTEILKSSSLDVKEKTVDGYRAFSYKNANGVEKTFIIDHVNDASKYKNGVKVSNEYYNEQVKDVEKKRSNQKAGLLETSRMLLDKLIGNDSLDVKHGYGKFMSLAIKHYFVSASMQDKKSMIAAGIRFKPEGEASPMAMMGAVLKGAGPIMQKMLQGLAGIDCGDDFKTALEDMRSNLASIPDTIVKAQLAEVVKNSNGKILNIQVTDKLGAASVGEAFMCTMTLAEKDPQTGANKTADVIVKILRPDAEQRMNREKELFRKAASQVKGMTVTFEGQLKSLTEELDLRVESGNTKSGAVYNRGSNNVKSAKILDIVEPTKYILIEEKAPGITVDRLVKKAKKEIEETIAPFRREKAPGSGEMTYGPVDKQNHINSLEAYKKAMIKLANTYDRLLIHQERLITLADKWAREGIYKSGFYHGDVHSGNIMTDDNFELDDKGRIKRDGKGAVIKNGGLTVIDFGNATQLTSTQQKHIVKMMSAAGVRDTNLFLDSFRELMTPEGRTAFDEQRNSIHDMVHNVFNLGSQQDAGKRIAVVLNKLMQMGHELPAPIFKFSQCQIRLQGSIDEINSMLYSIKKAMRKLSGADFGYGTISGYNKELFPSFRMMTDINGSLAEGTMVFSNLTSSIDSELRKIDGENLKKDEKKTDFNADLNGLVEKGEGGGEGWNGNSASEWIEKLSATFRQYAAHQEYGESFRKVIDGFTSLANKYHYTDICKNYSKMKVANTYELADKARGKKKHEERLADLQNKLHITKSITNEIEDKFNNLYSVYQDNQDILTDEDFDKWYAGWEDKSWYEEYKTKVGIYQTFNSPEGLKQLEDSIAKVKKELDEFVEGSDVEAAKQIEANKTAMAEIDKQRKEFVAEISKLLADNGIAEKIAKCEKETLLNMKASLEPVNGLVKDSDPDDFCNALGGVIGDYMFSSASNLGIGKSIEYLFLGKLSNSYEEIPR